jgi:acylglycerol lipase
MAIPDVRRLRERFAGPHELVRTSDGKILFVRHWIGSGRPDLAILLLHGITAYSGPYGKLMAEELASAGPEVFGLDLRGHGLSDGIRGDYPNAERLLRDLCETVALLKSQFSKVVVLGHSLGVLSAIIAANGCHPGVDGLILVSAGRTVRPGAYAKPTVGAALKALLGIAIFRTRRLIEYNRPGMLGRDDPLFNFRYTARFYSSVYGVSAGSVARMLRRNALDSPNLVIHGNPDLPLLVAVGDQDELFSVDSAQAFFSSLTCPRKEFIVIPGARHAAFPAGSWKPVVAWLGNRFPAPR